MSDSIQSIVDAVVKRIDREINERLPRPTCPVKREQHDWKVKQIKQQIAERLGNFVITIHVEV